MWSIVLLFLSVFHTLQQYVQTGRAFGFLEELRAQDIGCSLCLPGEAQLYSTAFQNSAISGGVQL